MTLEKRELMFKSVLVTIVLICSIQQNLFALDCEKISLTPKQFDAWIEKGLVPACMIKKQAYDCQEIENDLSGEDKKEIIQCDSNSVVANESLISTIPNAKCIVNGMELAVEPFVMFGNWLVSERKPGEKNAFDRLRDSVISSYNKEKNCNESEMQKKGMVDAFNLGIEDERYKLDYHNVVEWTCGQIAQQLSARNQAYQKNIYDEIIRNKIAGKPYTPLKPNKDAEAMAEIFKGMQSVWHCYTRQAKADMACKIVSAFAFEYALGFGIYKGLSTVSSVVKSKRALSRIKKAIKNVEAVNLDDAAKLRDSDRLKAAQNMLGIKRPLMNSEKKAILEAHEIGSKEGRGFFTYTQDDIAKKARILREADFNKDQIRMFMEAGITGNNPVEKARVAGIAFQKTRLTDDKLTPQIRAGIVTVLDTMMERLSKNQLVTFDELMKVAKTELSGSGLEPVQIERMVNGIHQSRVQISDLLNTQSTTTNSVVSTAAFTIKPGVAGSPPPVNNGATLTASNQTGIAATNTQRTVTSNSSPPAYSNTIPPKPNESIPTSTNTATTSKPTASASAEFVADPAKLQKIRAEIDTSYAKDKLHIVTIDDIPGDLTPEDIHKIGQLIGKPGQRDIDTVRNFSFGVKPADVEAWLSKPGSTPPESIKKLKVVFPKLSPENISELLGHAQKRTKDEITTIIEARGKRARADLDAIYGRGDNAIDKTIEASGLKMKEYKKQVESWEAKIKDPKTPSYSKQNYADQAERARRTVEIERQRCKKILDLYIIGYNMQDFTKRYKAYYDSQCAGL